ncbi:MAG: 5'-3' exonuclease H3TH domain-containing protein, partial [Thiohalocapsa sp.]
MPDRYPLVLVDASGYLFRAYHALPKLTNSRGEATGALVGVLNMLRKLIDEEKPEYIGVVFDASGPTFRDRIYEDYKANRPPMPEDLREQLGPLKEIIRAMGLPLLEVADVEADDVIGTLANRAAADGLPTLVSTGDKDMAQLVNEHITLVNTMSDTVLDPAGVKEKFGVAPEHIVDYLALMGDSIDNIPGVPKCGPKTAAKWIQEYGDLDGVLANAEKVKGKIGESLRASLEQLPLSRELTTIKTDVELDFAPTDLTPSPPDTETLRDWYERIESKRLLATLNDADGEAAENKPQPAYALVLQETELDAWLAKLEAADLFAFDTETTDLDYMRARVVGVSFAVDTDGAVEAAYVPLAHAYPGAPHQLDRERVLGRLKPLLEDPARPKVGQNLKYDMSVCANHGIAMSGIAHDTMLESYVLDSTATRHDMDSLAK